MLPYTYQQLMALRAMQIMYALQQQQQQQQQQLPFQAVQEPFSSARQSLGLGGLDEAAEDPNIQEDRDSIRRRRKLKLENPAKLRAGETRMAAMGISVLNDEQEELVYKYGREKAGQIDPLIAKKFQTAWTVATQSPQAVAASGFEWPPRSGVSEQQHRLTGISRQSLQMPSSKTPSPAPKSSTSSSNLSSSSLLTSSSVLKPKPLALTMGTSFLAPLSHPPSSSYTPPESRPTRSLRTPTSERPPNSSIPTPRPSSKLSIYLGEANSIYAKIPWGTARDEGVDDPNIEEIHRILVEEEAEEILNPKKFAAKKAEEWKEGYQEPTNAQKLLVFRVGTEKAMALDPDLAAKLQNNVKLQMRKLKATQ